MAATKQRSLLNKFAGAGAGAAAMTLAALPMAANISTPSEAFAQQAQPQVERVTTTPSVQVPISRAENVSLEGVRYSAAQASGGDRQVLVVYGSDEGSKNAVLRAAADAIQAGYPIRGVIFGPINEPSSIDFYANAMRTATFKGADTRNIDGIKSEIVRSNELIYEVRREIAARGNSPTVTHK